MIYLFPLLLVGFSLANILIGFRIHAFYLSSISAFLTLLVLPGFLLSQILRLKSYSFWETLAHAVGLSLAFVMFGGLLINELLPILGISQPLQFTWVTLSFDILLLVLFFLARPYLKHAKLQLTLPHLKPYDLVFVLIPLLFPLLAILGTISLNNGGTNLFTLLLLGGIGIYVFAAIRFRNQISPGIFPTALFFIGLSVLLMTSLRSWYILGHDIQTEYYVFQLTKIRPFWNIELFKDAYNACLSITILPTILANYINFNDMYIYKVIFQILFAIVPVIIYLFSKKFIQPVLAFVAAFFFISFPTFLNDMPMLNRQEIAFIFFALFMLVLFKSHRQRQPPILLYIYGAGIVVSHYSTNYITVGLLILIYFIHLCIRFPFLNKLFKRQRSIQTLFLSARKFSYRQSVSLSLILFLTAATFFWNSLITRTSGNLSLTILHSITNIGSIFHQDNKSVDVAYNIFFPRRTDDKEYLSNYVENRQTRAKLETATNLYPAESYKSYSVDILPNDLSPLTTFGQFLQKLGLDVFDLNYNLRQSLAKVLQILILIGFVGLWYYPTRQKLDVEYVIACGAGIFFIVLMTVLPVLSQNYGILRLFQQLLIFLGLPIVFGLIWPLRRIGQALAFYLAGIIAVIFFLSLSGFIDTLSGGYYPQLNLANSGLYYDIYYTREAELTAFAWLRREAPGETVQGDEHMVSKLLNYGQIYALEAVIPQTIYKGAYVYVGVSNIESRTVISTERSLTVTYPIDFLEKNKNLIYNNGKSRIYK